MCADYKVPVCEIHFDDEPASWPKRKNEALAKAKAQLQPGYFRNLHSDSDLVWKFGLVWSAEVAAGLDEDGRMSPGQAEVLLMRLKDNEHIFEGEMKELSASEAEHFRHRYTLLQRFLNSAIRENVPIHSEL